MRTLAPWIARARAAYNREMAERGVVIYGKEG
jgi:hypothetical protein